MRQTVITLALLISTTIAAATPLPRYLIAVWDGQDTGPGLWFAAEGADLPHDVRLSPVTVLPVGTVIGAETGQLSVSSAMAVQFGMKPGEPILVEVLAGSDATNRPDAVSEKQSPATAATARRDRIKSLLRDLRDAAAAERQALEGTVQ
ncbi:MAG: hypothetical protein AAFZ09_07230 [Pseudomonadota bacterium]